MRPEFIRTHVASERKGDSAEMEEEEMQVWEELVEQGEFDGGERGRGKGAEA